MNQGEAWRAAWPFSGLAGVVLGSALQLQQAQLWPWKAYAVLMGAGLLGLWAIGALRTRWVRGVLAVALVCGACLGAALAGGRACAFAADVLDPSLEGRDLQVSGMVAQMPQRFEGGIRFRFDVEAAPPGVRLPPRIALGWYAQEGAAAGPLPRAGERWQFTVRLKAPHGSRNPHGFDFELWAWEQGVQASGYVRDGASGDGAPRRIARSWAHPVERAREATRDAIDQRIADPRIAGVIAALVTGDQAAIERGDWDVFRATGVAHLMSISGLHVTLFAWLAGWLVGALWRRSERLMLLWPAPLAALVGGVLLAAGYALFSGWGVPSQRTVCMLAVVALLRIGGWHWPWPLAWLAACAAVVLLDPWALMQAGFWLSFVAVGVLFAADSGAPGRQGRLVQLLREQAVVTLALTPLGILLFHQVSLVGLLANLLAIPWVTLVLTPLALLGVLLPPLWDAAAWALQALMWLLRLLAAWPWATLSAPAPPLWAAIGGVAGGLLLAMRLPVSLRCLGLPLLLPALLWQPPRPAPGEFELLAADVGQGGAVLVRTARHSLLYDAGPRYGVDSDAGQRVLVPLLRALDERLDLVVLSHRDNDHTGGAAAVLAMQAQAQLLSSIEAAHPLQKIRPAQPCVAGQHWEWDGVRFELLHPQPGDAQRAGLKPNALSCVLRVASAQGTALLAGDIEREQEATLVATQAEALRADVLLAPHHGSKTSSSPSFIAAVAPRLVIAQAGYRNRFGHPAPEVRQRYEAAGAFVADTARCGALRWRSGDPVHWVCERDASRRYWQHDMP